MLVDGLHARAVVVGANFRFGHRAAGDVATLRELGDERGFVAEGIALDGGPQVWSSTYVRTCLAAGDVAGAAEALGRPYAVRGVVVAGDQRGRELGYPTANVPTDGLTAAPADGVYAGWLRRAATPASGYPAAISVGTNPTFDGQRERRVEAYVLDRTDLELYGVRGRGLLRARGCAGWSAFDGVDALVEPDGRRRRPRPRAAGGAAREAGVRRTPPAATEQWFLQHGLPYFVPEERRAARAALRPRRVRAAGRGRGRCWPPAPAGCWRWVVARRSPWRPALLISLGAGRGDLVRAHRAAAPARS